MAFSYVLMQVLPSLSVNYNTPSSPAEHLSNILFDHKRSGIYGRYYNKCGDASSIVLFYTCSYKRQFLQEGIWAIGKVEVKRLPENELGLLNAHFGTSSTLVAVFYRLQKGGTLFYSELYRRVKIRNSFTVCYKLSGTEFCGNIMYFVIIRAANSSCEKICNTEHSYWVSTCIFYCNCAVFW